MCRLWAVIIVNPGHDIDDLKNAMAVNMESSPNCAEFMHKYRSKESRESIVSASPSLPECVGCELERRRIVLTVWASQSLQKEIRVRWAVEGRDSKTFPRETILTDENVEPVLRMMAIGVGKDVFDIRVESKKVEQKK
jgi:hypothetical protein